MKTPQRPHSTITSPSRWTRRIDGRTYWGEGKEKHGGFELKRWCTALSLSIFSASLSQPTPITCFSEGNGSQSGRRPWPPPTAPPSHGRSVVYPSNDAPVHCSSEGERDPTMQKERRAAMANAYTLLQCNRELTYAFETGARARPPTPAPVLLIARCLWIAP